MKTPVTTKSRSRLRSLCWLEAAGRDCRESVSGCLNGFTAVSNADAEYRNPRIHVISRPVLN
jgi:hypothetical protein